MRIKVSREALLKGIQTVLPVVPTRSTLPILSHLLIETKKNGIYLAGTDLEVGISCVAEAEVVEEGATTVPAKRFSDLVKELPPEASITLSTKKNQQVSLECGRSLFKLVGLPREEFPRLPTPEDSGAMVIDQGVLQAMLGLTSFAVSHDESRYVLNGILFFARKGWLKLVATDGRRLALVSRDISNTPNADSHAVVPIKTINELNRLLGEGPTLKIIFKETQIAFDLGNTQIISRLIEGKFPNYEQVVPQEAPQKLKVGRQALLLAARRIGLWTTQESPSIRLDLKANQLVLSKQTQEAGEAHEEISAAYTGPESSIGFNPHYLIDVLKVLTDEEVEFELPGPDRPGVIRTKDHYTYIVLPMQLGP
jgi:DNA polymerase-3 subunit beta